MFLQRMAERRVIIGLWPPMPIIGSPAMDAWWGFLCLYDPETAQPGLKLPPIMGKLVKKFGSPEVSCIQLLRSCLRGSFCVADQGYGTTFQRQRKCNCPRHQGGSNQRKPSVAEEPYVGLG